MTNRNLTASVWKFQPGDHLFIRGRDGLAVIVDRLPGPGWPHYSVMDAEGDLYRVCQLELSLKPFPFYQ